MLLYIAFSFFLSLNSFPFSLFGFCAFRVDPGPRSGLILARVPGVPPQIYAQIRLFCAKFGFYIKFSLIPLAYIKIIYYFYIVNKTLKHAARVDKYGALRV